jgi:hypothetical protein
MSTLSTITSVANTPYNYTYAINPYIKNLSGTTNSYWGYKAFVYGKYVTSYYQTVCTVLNTSDSIVRNTIAITPGTSEHKYYPSCFWIEPYTLLVVYIKPSSYKLCCRLYDVYNNTFGSEFTIYTGSSGFGVTNPCTIKMDASGDIHVVWGGRTANKMTALYAYHRRGNAWGTWSTKLWYGGSTPSLGTAFNYQGTASMIIRENRIFIGIAGGAGVSNNVKFSLTSKLLTADPSTGWPTSWDYQSGNIDLSTTTVNDYRCYGMNIKSARDGSLYFVWAQSKDTTPNYGLKAVCIPTSGFTDGEYSSGLLINGADSYCSGSSGRNEHTPVLLQNGDYEMLVVFRANHVSSSIYELKEVKLSGVTWDTPSVKDYDSSYSYNYLPVEAQSTSEGLLSGSCAFTEAIENTFYVGISQASTPTNRYLGKLTDAYTSFIRSSSGITTYLIGSASIDYDEVGVWPISEYYLGLWLSSVEKIPGTFGYPAYFRAAFWLSGDEPSEQNYLEYETTFTEAEHDTGFVRLGLPSKQYVTDFNILPYVGDDVYGICLFFDSYFNALGYVSATYMARES